MILLDTNIIPEAMRPEPHPPVLCWFDDQVADTLYLSSVTVAEPLSALPFCPRASHGSGFPTP